MSVSGSHWWNFDQMNDKTVVFYFKITHVPVFIS